MKKSVFSILLALVLCLNFLAGCAPNSVSDHNHAHEAETQTEAGGVLFLTVNPEIAIHFDQNGTVTDVRAENDDGIAITSGYTNGMIGYLANAVQIGEGGYEPEGSALYFAVAGTYPVSTQETIEQGLLALTK